MADVPNRDTLEARLARELARLGSKHLDELLAQLGDPPSVDNVDPSFWRDYGDGLRQALTPFLARVYAEGASAAAAEAPGVLGVDWALPNTVAASWAENYTFDLVTGIEATTRDLLRDAVARAYDQGLQPADVADSLASIFGPVRAEMIAVTEVTRAAAEGNAAVIDDLASRGVEMVGIWQTANDEVVCPICAPLDGVQAEGGVFTNPDTGDDYRLPPAHPRCRCIVNYTMKDSNGG